MNRVAFGGPAAFPTSFEPPQRADGRMPPRAGAAGGIADRLGSAGGAGGVAGPGSGAARPILDQVSQTFERLLDLAGVKFGAISSPGERLMDRIGKIRDALAQDPGLLQRLQQQDPTAFRQLQQFRNALEAMLPSLRGPEYDAAKLAVDQIDAMSGGGATSGKPIVPPTSQL